MSMSFPSFPGYVPLGVQVAALIRKGFVTEAHALRNQRCSWTARELAAIIAACAVWGIDWTDFLL